MNSSDIIKPVPASNTSLSFLQEHYNLILYGGPSVGIVILCVIVYVIWYMRCSPGRRAKTVHLSATEEIGGHGSKLHSAAVDALQPVAIHAHGAGDEALEPHFKVRIVKNAATVPPPTTDLNSVVIPMKYKDVSQDDITVGFEGERREDMNRKFLSCLDGYARCTKEALFKGLIKLKPEIGEYYKELLVHPNYADDGPLKYVSDLADVNPQQLAALESDPHVVAALATLVTAAREHYDRIRPVVLHRRGTYVMA